MKIITVKTILLISIFLGFDLLFIQECNANEFAYRPYPSILVHGFRSDPVGTWGLQTKKEEEEDLKMSTFIRDSATANADIPIGWELIQQYNNVPGFGENSTMLNERFVPHEEVGSYSDINHTFVEAYCSFYRYESNDGDGTRYPRFSAPNEPNNQYDISRGGQTQLLRIRIIQTLNEYYGDFKWVDDPTAKVRLVGHSNGSVVINNLLKNESFDNWYNDGFNGQGCSVDNIELRNGKYYVAENVAGNNSTLYKIDGLGFKLRDRVDLAVTLNGPFAGTAFANKYGIPSVKFSMILGMIFGGWAPAAVIASLSDGKADVSLGMYAINAALFSLYAYALGTGMLAGIEEYGFGNSNNPLFMDDSRFSDFTKHMKGNGLPPLYSSGNIIPYVNFRSDLKSTGTMTNLVGTVPFYTLSATSFALYIFDATPKRLFWAIYCAYLGTASLLTADWLFNSDGIIDSKSQFMSEIYNYPSYLKGPRPIEHYERQNDSKAYGHTTFKNRGDIIRSMFSYYDHGSDLTFTHAIPLNYTGTKSTNPFEDTVIVKQRDAGGNELNRQRIVQFNGMNPAVFEDTKRWSTYYPGPNKIEVGRSTGGAGYVVANLKSHFINKATAICKVNLWDWETLEYGTHFGNFAARLVDDNWDGIIDTNDFCEGSYIFVPTTRVTEQGQTVSKTTIGLNNVYLQVNTKAGPIIRHVRVLRGDAVAIPFEVDSTGTQIVNPNDKMLYNVTQWRETDEKDIYIGFETRVKTAQGEVCFDGNGDDSVTLERANSCSAATKREPNVGEWDYYYKHSIPGFSRLDDVNPVDSTVILDCDSNSAPEIPRFKNYMKIKAAFNHVIKDTSDASKPALIQQISVKVRTDSYKDVETGKKVTGGTSSIFNIPFLIDNEPPIIQLKEPLLVNDYNYDGLYDPETDTLPRIVLPPGLDTLSGVDTSRLAREGSNGVDDDGDLIIDDLGEFENISFYSPQWNDEDTLVSRPFQLYFELNDNADIILPTGKFLKWTLYKVSGDEYDSSVDAIVFSDTLKYVPKFRSHYLFEWAYEAIKDNSEKNGLYCVIVECVDRADNSNKTDPAYFIIDTKKPDISVLSNWKNENGLGSVLNSQSNSLGFRYTPKRPTDKYDTETKELLIRLHALAPDGSILGRDPYEFSSIAGFSDVYTNTDSGTIALDDSGNIIDVPDNELDATSFNVNTFNFLQASGDIENEYNLIDGKYSVEVVAKDKAGNEVHIEELEDSILTVDREKPVFSEYTVFPTLFHEDSTQIRLIGKISEKNDAPSNKTDKVFNKDQVFKFRVTFAGERIIDSTIMPSADPSSNYYTNINLLLGNFFGQLKYGKNSLIVEIEDPHFNVEKAVVHFFYKSMGNEILNEFNEGGIAGTVAINGIVSDPDESNFANFDHYELHVRSVIDSTYHNDAVYIPGSSNNSSSELIRVNDVMGYVKTWELTDGDYILELRVFEVGISEPTIIEKPFTVNHSIVADTLDPILTAAFPRDTFAVGDTTFTYTYTLQNRVCDVKTKIVHGASGEVVFRERHTGVMPFEEGVPDFSFEGNNFANLYLYHSSNTWYMKWRLPYSIIIKPFTGTLGDLTVNDSTLIIHVDTLSDILTISSLQNYTVDNEYAISFDASFVTGGKLSHISVLAGGSSEFTAGVVKTGLKKLSPPSGSFSIMHNKSFSWNGKSLLGREVNNGEYLVHCNATASNGLGYAQIDEKSIYYQASSPLVIEVNSQVTPLRLDQTGIVNPGSEAVVSFSVNKVSSVDIKIYKVGENIGQDKLVWNHTMDGAISGVDQFLSFIWDGRCNTTEWASPNVKYVAYLSASAGGELAQTSGIAIPVYKAFFDTTSNGKDPIIVTGNKKGFYKKDSLQVVSGDTRAYVNAHYSGKYYKPVQYSYKVGILRQNPLKVHCNYSFKTSMDYKKYVHAFLPKQTVKSRVCRTDTGMVIASFKIDQKKGWSFDSLTASGIHGCDSISMNDYCGSIRPCFENHFIEYDNMPYSFLDRDKSTESDDDILNITFFDRYKYGKKARVPRYYVLVNKEDKSPKSGFWKYGFHNSGDTSFVLKTDYTVNNMFTFLPMISFSKDIWDDHEIWPSNSNQYLIVDDDTIQINEILLSWNIDEAIISFDFEQVVYSSLETYKNVFLEEGNVPYPNNDWKQAFIKEFLDSTGIQFSDKARFRANYSIRELRKMLRLQPTVLQQSGTKQFDLPVKDFIVSVPGTGNLDYSASKTISWNLGNYCDWYHPDDSLYLEAKFDMSICQVELSLQGPDDSCIGCIYEDVIDPGDSISYFTLDRDSGAYSTNLVYFEASKLGLDSFPDVSKIIITPMMMNDTGWIPADDAISVTSTKPSGSLLDVAFKITNENEVADSIVSWNPPFVANDSLLLCDSKLNENGDLVFMVETPDEIADWDTVTFIEQYEKDSLTVQTGKQPLFDTSAGSGVIMNPHLLIDSIEVSVKYFDDSDYNALTNNLIKPDNNNYNEIELALDFDATQDNKNIVKLNIEPKFTKPDTCQYFSIEFYQHGRGEKIALDIENSAQNLIQSFYWDAINIGGEFSLQLHFYNLDSTGTRQNEIVFEQSSYIGYIIADSAYGTEDNYTAKSPYKRAEIIYNPQGGNLVFDSIQVSSINTVDLMNAGLTGVTPYLGDIDVYSPAISATPSPITFENDKRPALKFRYLRDEIVKIQGTDTSVLVTPENLTRIYHVNNRTGELSDITSGAIDAIDYGDDVQFNSNHPNFIDSLKHNTKWDYLEILATPKEFSHCLPLREAHTILDRVDLYPGKFVRPQDLSILGKFVPFDGDTLQTGNNPSATGYSILLDLDQGIPNRNINEALLRENSTILVDSSTTGVESEFTVDTLIPTVRDGDTVFVYGFATTDDTISANSATGFAYYIIKSKSTGFKLEPVNQYISQTNKLAYYNVIPTENGKMNIIQYDKNGIVESTKDKNIVNLDTFQIEFTDVNPFGQTRAEGNYPFNIFFYDFVGNLYGENFSGEFIVDYTPPQLSDAEVSLKDSNSLTYNLTGFIRDNFEIYFASIAVVGDETDTLTYFSVLCDASEYNLNAPLMLIDPWKYKHISIHIDLADIAGNNSNYEIPLKFIDEEEYERDWQYSKKIKIVVPDNIYLNEDIKDFPALISLTDNNFTFSEAQPDGRDIRFVDLDGYPLLYDVESWDIATNSANIWVRIPVIQAGTSEKEFVMYWGNDNAKSLKWLSKGTWNDNFKAVYHLHKINSGTTPIGLDPELAKYGLYAHDSLFISYKVDVLNGSIGSNTVVKVDGGGSSSYLTNVQGDIVSGGNVALMDYSNIDGDVIAASTVSVDSTVTVNGSIIQNSIVPQLTIPEKEVTYSGNDVYVSNYCSCTLPPGNYEDVTLCYKSTLKLKAGVYNLRKLRVVGDCANLKYDIGPDEVIDINVKCELDFSENGINSYFVRENNPLAVRFYTDQTTTLYFGENSTFYGIYIAPKAKIIACNNVTLTGALYGNKVKIYGYSDINIITDSGSYASMVLDATVNNNNGIPNGPSITSGKISNGVLFDSTTDTIIISDSYSLRMPENFTISAWINRDSVESIGAIASKHDGTKGWQIGLNQQGNALFHTNDITLMSDTTIDTNTWSHLGAVFDNDSMKIFINGQLRSNPEIVIGWNGTSENSPLYLGKWFEEGTYLGVLDEVRISDAARSPAWLNLGYENQKENQQLIQVTPNKPSDVTTTIEDDNVIINLNVPEYVDSVVFERRQSGVFNLWTQKELVYEHGRGYVDYTSECEKNYDYRIQFVYGKTKSAWSDIVIVVMPDCYGGNEIINIKAMVLDTSNSPINNPQSFVVIKFFATPDTDVELYHEELDAEIINGWLNVILGYNHRLKEVVHTNDRLFVEIDVDGITQTPRTLLASDGMTMTKDIYRMTGSGNPNGKIDAKTGTIYIDVDNRKIYFKIGPSMDEWRELK